MLIVKLKEDDIPKLFVAYRKQDENHNLQINAQRMEKKAVHGRWRWGI